MIKLKKNGITIIMKTLLTLYNVIYFNAGKIFFSAILLFNFSAITAQDFPPSINKREVNWDEWEVAMSNEEKLIFIESLNKIMGIEIALKAYNYTLANIINNFHIVDINNDGQNDVIYTGFVGGRNNGVILFEIQDSVCRKPLVLLGELIEIWREDVWAPVSFKVHNYRCCSGYVDFIETYNPQFDFRQEIRYEVSSKLGFAHGTAIPDFFHKPDPIKVISDSCLMTLRPALNYVNYDYHLKTTPVVDVFPYKEVYFKFDGNLITHYSKGSIGFVLAEHLAENGEMWWFVMMNSDNKTTYSIFCPTGDNNHLPYKVLGWIKSKHLEAME